MTTSPLRLVVTWSIKPGKQAAFLAMARDIADAMKATEPGAVGFEWYLAPDGTTATILEAYRDAPALMAHVRGPIVTERMPKLMGLGDLTGVQLFGDPTPELAQALKPFNAAASRHLFGYTR